MQPAAPLLSALVLAGALVLPARAAPLSEDVEFGVRLVEERFFELGIDVLGGTLEAVESEPQKVRILRALVDAHRHFSRATYPRLSTEAANKERARHRDMLERHQKELDELGPRTTGTVAEFLKQRARAEQLAQRAARAGGEHKEQLTEDMIRAFERAVKGLKGLTAAAAEAIENHEKNRPEKEGEFAEWGKAFDRLRGEHANAGYELNRTRFAFYRALPARYKEQKEKLLKTIIDHLEILCPEYGLRGETIIGQLTLAKAYLAAKRFDDAARSARTNLLLVQDAVKAAPRVAEQLKPWENRTRAVLARALARKGEPDIQQGIQVLGDSTQPEVVLARAELYLMRALKLAHDPKQESRAKLFRQKAVEMLDALVEKHPQWEGEAVALRERSGLSGTGARSVLLKIQEARRANDNKAIIRLVPEFLAFGDAVKPEQRATALKLLAIAYRQEALFYEAFTVYRHIVHSGMGGEQAGTYGKLARLMMKKKWDQTGDDVDKDMYLWAKNWFLETFGGEAKQYEDGRQQLGDKQYRKAIATFEEVPRESLYYESAMVKLAEARFLLARRLRDGDPAQAKKLLDRARADLEQFIQRAKKKSIHPTVNQRRERLLPTAIYRLGRIYVWPEREDYEAYAALTEGFVDRFPDAAGYYPYVLYYRVLAQVRLGRLTGAEKTFGRFERLVEGLEGEEKERGEELLRFANGFLFHAHARAASKLRAEADELEAKAEKTEDVAEAEELVDRAAEKRANALRSANRALGIVTAAIDRNPDQPYEKVYWAVGEFHHQNRLNEGLPYLELFIKKFGDDRALGAERRRQVEKARLLLGRAYYETGQYDKAYAHLKEQYEKLDEAFARRKRVNDKAAPPAYWAATRMDLARAAQKLAPGSDARLKEALGHFIDLLGKLPEGSGHWWDAVASIAELWNLDGRYEDNLRVLRRRAATSPRLGGEETRRRLETVVREIYDRSEAGDRKRKARNVLIHIRAADADERTEKKQYSEALDAIDAAVGLDENLAGSKDTFLKWVRAALEGAADEEVRARARALQKRLQ
ncbi:MAG: tetratricopeptide repeat protein [Planctomycetota bacterium]